MDRKNVGTGSRTSSRGRIGRTGGMLALALFGSAVVAGWTSHAAAFTLSWVRNGKIAFVSNADGDKEIYTIERDGTGRTQLTFNGASDVSPVFSPDGTRIAFASNRDGDFDIYIMKLDGTGLVNLTSDSDAADTSPTWSPNGLSLAFTSNRAGRKQIFVKNLLNIIPGAPSVHQLTTTGRNQDPSWGVVSGQQRIFYTCRLDGDDDICSIPAAGGAVTKLTDNSVPDQHPRYRGGKVFYHSKFNGNDFEVVRMNGDGSGKQALTSNSVQDKDPVGSPDGKAIAYLQKSGKDMDLIVAKADGTAPVAFTNDADKDETPDWQIVPLPDVFPTQVYDVHTVSRGTEVDVSFKTTDNVTDPIVTMFDGANLDGLQKGFGTGKNWVVTVGGLHPAKSYDLIIQLTFGPNKYVFYEHPTPITTLERKVTVTARYAFVLNDGDPGSCGDMGLQFYLAYDITTRAYLGPQNGNACSGSIWNFPNKTMVIDNYADDYMPVIFEACDYDDTEGAECSSGDVQLDLLAEPGNFTKTREVDVWTPYNDPDGDVAITVTYDYTVTYHP
jgi:Tol biopolymer transport system component